MGVKISSLTIKTPLAGTEEFEINDSGSTKKTTAQDIANLAPTLGTVTSVSAGNLSPLFTTNVATPSSTPAITFSLSNAAQNAVLAGPSTGGAGAPTYRALVAADIPDLSGTYQPLDPDLTAIAALGFTATAFLKKTAANTWALDTATYLPLSGGTLTGALTLNADPTNALHAATKQYVDSLAISYSAGSGLTLDSTTFKLGGSVTENTTFSGSGFNITWGSSGTRLGNYRVWSNGTIGLDGNTTAFLQTDSNTIATTTAGISVGTVGPIVLNTDAGTAGQVLTSAGAAAPPTWSLIGSGSVDNTIWKVGGNTLSGASVLGSTSAQDITMTVGNANFLLNTNGTESLRINSTQDWLVGGGTLTSATRYDFRGSASSTTIARFANNTNQSALRVQGVAGELLLGTGTSTFISPATQGSNSITGSGLALRGSNVGGIHMLIGASNMGINSQIDETTTAGAMLAVSSTAGFWHRVRPSFQNTTSATSVEYTILGLVPTFNITGGSTTIHVLDFNPTETSLVSTTKYGITVGGTGWLSGFGTRTPTALLHVGPVTTSYASLRIEAGSTTTAPSSPNSGDMWHEGTNNRLMFRQGSNSMEVVVSDGTTTAGTTPAGTIRIRINGTNYDLLHV